MAEKRKVNKRKPATKRQKKKMTLSLKNAKTLKEVVSWLPLDRILLETDCPYLTPHPFRGEQNEPSYLKFVSAEIANLKDLPKDIVEEEASKNSLEFFNIKEENV